MKYAEYAPAPQLKPYIDAYWTLETDRFFKPVNRPIFADGCTEIFINVGGSAPVVNSISHLKPGNIYLGGTMSRASVVTSLPNSRFVGIRFSPAGFAAFYKLPVSEIVDEVIEFPDKALSTIAVIDSNLSSRLENFFVNKIHPSPLRMVCITNAIDRHKGIINVDLLAKEYNLTTRTLERSFLREVGISPKTFINIVKFIHTSKRIRKNNSKDSLLRIAHEMGYYDHSHLTHEIKKFSGLNPSDIAHYEVPN